MSTRPILMRKPDRFTYLIHSPYKWASAYAGLYYVIGAVVSLVADFELKESFYLLALGLLGLAYAFNRLDDRRQLWAGLIITIVFSISAIHLMTQSALVYVFLPFLVIAVVSIIDVVRRLITSQLRWQQKN